MGSLRHNQRTRARVIAEFRRVGRVDLACAAAGVDRTSHYVWMKNDPDYAEAFEQARPEATGLLEDEAFRRAYKGTVKPMSVGGKLMMVTEFDSQLLMFLLKSHNPAKYGDRRFMELTGKDGKPLIPLGAVDALIHDSDPDQ